MFIWYVYLLYCLFVFNITCMQVVSGRMYVFSVDLYTKLFSDLMCVFGGHTCCI